jgi:plastocyanin
MEHFSLKTFVTAKKLVITIFIVAVVLLGILLRQSYQKSPSKTDSHPPILGSSDPMPQENVITLSKSGFSPDTITIKTDTAVRWKNAKGEDASVNSDDHPTNKKYPFLNLGKFKDGQTLVYIFKNKGTFTYHNYFNPDEKGTIIVE